MRASACCPCMCSMAAPCRAVHRFAIWSPESRPWMTRRDRVALLLFVAAIIGTALWLHFRMRQAAWTPGPSTTIQKFEVAPGSSMRSVLHLLESQQLIGDARMLEWYLRCCQRGTALAGTSVKAGRYRIVPGQPPIE